MRVGRVMGAIGMAACGSDTGWRRHVRLVGGWPGGLSRLRGTAYPRWGWVGGGGHGEGHGLEVEEKSPEQLDEGRASVDGQVLPRVVAALGVTARVGARGAFGAMGEYE